MPVVLHLGQDQEAVLLPERGGLLSKLRLAPVAPSSTAKSATPAAVSPAADVLWMPTDFSLDESGWPGGGMPLMFPFAGRVFHEGRALSYQVGGQAYHMPLHGFAYGLPWQVSEQTASSVELTLRSGTRTYELFPYDFVLRTRYTLVAGGLQVEVQIRHLGGKAEAAARMPVAMGFHPYFALGLGGGRGDPARVLLQTSAAAKIRVTPVGGAGKTAAFPETPEEAEGALADPLLHNVILGEMAQPSAEIRYPDVGLRLKLSWSEAVRYLVLWTQPGKGFHCVEPWMGLPDALHNGEGLRTLAAGEEMRFSFSIRLETDAG